MSIKTGEVNLNFILEGMPYYVQNWAAILKSLGINTCRINDGAYGQVGINPLTHPDTWHTKLDSILTLLKDNGFKAYFNWMGDETNSEFGIYDLQLGMSGRPTTIDFTQAKTVIDLLGDYGFLTDNRLSHWVVGNESNIENIDSYNSLIQLTDYMRGKGAKVAAGDWSFNWDNSTARIVPKLKEHVDLIEIHQYGIYDLVHNFSLGGNSYDWAGWKTFLINYWNTQFANSEGMPIYLGEMGLELYQSRESWGMYATEQNRRDYFTNYFSVTKNYPLKWISFHSVFPAGNVSEPNWGLFDAYGNKLAGADEVATYYGAYVPVDPTEPPIEPPIEPQAEDNTGFFLLLAVIGGLLVGYLLAK